MRANGINRRVLTIIDCSVRVMSAYEVRIFSPRIPPEEARAQFVVLEEGSPFSQSSGHATAILNDFWNLIITLGLTL